VNGKHHTSDGSTNGKKHPVPFGKKMNGPQSQPGQGSEEKTPSSVGNQTQVTFLSHSFQLMGKMYF